MLLGCCVIPGMYMQQLVEQMLHVQLVSVSKRVHTATDRAQPQKSDKQRAMQYAWIGMPIVPC